MLAKINSAPCQPQHSLQGSRESLQGLGHPEPHCHGRELKFHPWKLPHMEQGYSHSRLGQCPRPLDISQLCRSLPHNISLALISIKHPYMVLWETHSA